MAFTTGDNNFGTAKWIVDATAGQGTHTTIAAALTAASSGQTIFIRPGTYTENLTLKAGVNLVAYTADAVTPNVTISGKCTFTAAGTVTISGIRLQTNSDYLLEITGANASIVNLYDCYLNCTNNTGINLSAAAGVINLVDSEGDVGTTGIALFTAPGGGMDITNCNFSNSGGTSTASNWSGTGSAGIFYSSFGIPLSTSGSTFSFTFGYCIFDGTATSPITHNCTVAAASTVFKSFVGGGANSSISIGAGASLNVYNCEIQSSNTNAITGTGTLTCSLLDFIGSSSTINATLSTTFIPLRVNQGGTGVSTFNTNGVVISNTAGTGSLAALSLTNGQVVIGSTGLPPAAATLTAGTGISIGTGANSITISATGAGFAWTTVAGTTQTIVKDNGYINGNAGLTTFTLPATGAVGDTFQIAGYGAGGWTIAQNASQLIYVGSSTSTTGVGGSVSSTNRRDTVEVMCVVANNEWHVLDWVGNLTVV